MTAADRVGVEIAKLDAVLAHRGGWHEDEEVTHKAFVSVRQWMADEKEESDRIELEAMEAAEAAEEAERKAQPNYATREMFKNTKINVPTKGK